MGQGGTDQFFAVPLPGARGAQQAERLSSARRALQQCILSLHTHVFVVTHARRSAWAEVDQSRAPPEGRETHLLQSLDDTFHVLALHTGYSWSQHLYFLTLFEGWVADVVAGRFHRYS